MPVVNFGFTKIDATKGDLSSSIKMNVDDSIGIKDIKELELKISEGQKVVMFTMNFNATYKQNDEVKANINIISNIKYMDSNKAIDEVIKNWADKKPISAEILSKIHNLALKKSLIHALSLADSLGLPAPVMLPKIKVKA